MSTNRWFIVTNTENLEFFFHCGLIVDKQGFSGNAYVADIMQDRPEGYIPCFPQTNLWNALKAAKSEDENLAECLIEIDIKQIYCPSAFCRTENLEEESYRPFVIEKEINESSKILFEVLLPAPLPLSCAKKIILKDSKELKPLTDKHKRTYGGSSEKFITAANKKEITFFKEPQSNQAVNNLDLDSSDNNQETQSLTGEHIPPRQLNYQQAFSYGGALSLLYYQTKNGRQSTKIFDNFSSYKKDISALQNIAPLQEVFFTKENDLDEYAKLYNQVINCVFKYNDLGEARYNVLQLLNNKEILPAGYFRDCVGLANSLTQLIERTHPDDSDTIFTKLIEHYEAKETGRSKFFLLLTMFFVRDNSETMLKYYHSEFTEEDYALLAIFFGAINGFINTPATIRKTYNLATWASFKMAEYIHGQTEENRTSFSEPLKPCLIYDNCFKKSSTNNKIHLFYIWLSRYFSVPDNEFITWKQNESYKQTKDGQIFKTLPTTKAILSIEKLEKLIMNQTINESDEIFNINIIIDEYKKKS
ncbi:hypothetical protein [Endozoicomonas sp. YOMI1]|uniref:hypothetical protein n=1 Tax=Endozoicomonas sp. YOMI1 TaxID=2828739 RepID=UPI002148B2B3|nr:hypothetical protein [Endozoicomonas sp. YOMI1]